MPKLLPVTNAISPTRTSKICLSSTAVAAVLTAVSAKATGFALPDQDAFAVGRGMAVVATADNPSAIAYNPAGITQLKGNNLRAGIYAIDLEPTFQRNSDGREFENQDKLHAVPQLFYTFGPEKGPVSFGFGVYSPFGLGLEWPQDTGFRTLGTRASLSYFTANPVVAVEICPTLSLGAGFTANYAQVDLQEGLVWPGQPYDKFRFKGDGWDYGFNLGALWKPIDQLAFGGTLRSATSVPLHGHAEYYNTTDFPPGAVPPLVPAFPTQRVGAEADYTFPLQVVGGVSYRPTPKWNLEFDAEYTDWNAFDTLTIKQDQGFGNLIPQNIPIAFKWESSWYYEFGVTRFFDNGWHVSAGYILNENSVPNANYSPLVADLERHFFSTGVGYRGQRFDFDLAYEFGWGPSHTVSGSAPSLVGQTADGSYEYISHAIAASVGLHF